MLNSLNLNDKTYDELIREAIAQIPLYTREWTNFNVSDPGITMLENMTAFQLLQQESIDEVPDEARRKLLKLMGYQARENRPANILVQSPPKGGPVLQAGYRLWSGDIPFETVEDVDQSPWSLAAVYVCESGKEEHRDISYLLDSHSDAYAYPLGKRPEAGNTMICVFKGKPEIGTELHLWLQVAEEELRNPFNDENQLPTHSHFRWQYYTASGWQDARVEDGSQGLLRAGPVSLWLEGDEPVPYPDAPIQGCAVRCVVDEANFDRAPRLLSLSAHLFLMRQQDTRAQILTFPGNAPVSLSGRLPEMGYYYVFCKETEDGPYRLYQENYNGSQGRFFNRVASSWGGAMLTFDKEDFGYGPCDADDAVLVSCFDGEMINHRNLGLIYGFEDQEVELDLVKGVLPDKFSLLMETLDHDGVPEYRLVRPNEEDPERLCYEVRSHSGRLVIHHPGLGGGTIYLGDCVITEGSKGNLRPGCSLEERGGYDGDEVETTYYCPGPGWNGVTYESVEELRRRFSGDMRRMSVAARIEDYERLVRETPGLCIHKVKAEADGRRNLVRITVKPHTDQKLPSLSEDYIRQICAYLEPRRMLTTRFEILQPLYVPVGVKCTLLVRGEVTHAQEEVEKLLRGILDHINGPQAFGGWVRFHEIYQALNALPFVQTVEALNIMPENRNGTLVGSDIQLGAQSLCYPGTFQLNLREQIK